MFLEAKLTLKDQHGNTPLHYSIIGHRDDMLSTLIQNRVDPGIINQGLFFILSENPFLKINHRWLQCDSFGSNEKFQFGTTNYLVRINF